MAGEAVDRFLQCLTERGVGVDVACQLVDREVPLLGQGQLGQQFRNVRSDEVPAEQFAVLLVGDQLDETGRVTETVCLAVGSEREVRDLDVVASALACSSVKPNEATCGWQNVARGIIR